MEGSYAIQKISLYFLLILFLLSCSKQTSQFSIAFPDLPDTVEFRQGDIICRLGNGFFSNYFREYSGPEKRYSHIGLIEVQSDTVFVIHTEASELTGIGYARRESINHFLSGSVRWGLYRFNLEDSVKCRIVDVAKSYYYSKTPFDLQFDLSDDSRLYCSEYIAVAINKGTKSELINPMHLINRKRFYGKPPSNNISVLSYRAYDSG